VQTTALNVATPFGTASDIQDDPLDVVPMMPGLPFVSSPIAWHVPGAMQETSRRVPTPIGADSLDQVSPESLDLIIAGAPKVLNPTDTQNDD
jgi:hypothetical protein